MRKVMFKVNRAGDANIGSRDVKSNVVYVNQLRNQGRRLDISYESIVFKASRPQP